MRKYHGYDETLHKKQHQRKLGEQYRNHHLELQQLPLQHQEQQQHQYHYHYQELQPLPLQHQEQQQHQYQNHHQEFQHREQRQQQQQQQQQQQHRKKRQKQAEYQQLPPQDQEQHQQQPQQQQQQQQKRQTENQQHLNDYTQQHQPMENGYMKPEVEFDETGLDNPPVMMEEVDEHNVLPSGNEMMDIKLEEQEQPESTVGAPTQPYVSMCDNLALLHTIERKGKL